MPRARSSAEIIEKMDPRQQMRGRTLAEFATREGMLQAADEVEKLIFAEDDPAETVEIIRVWVRVTREEAALAAAEYENG